MDEWLTTAVEGDVPAWSGEFWVWDEFGYLAVHYADQRQHCPPERGWVLVRTLDDDDEAEVFCYRRVTGEGLEHYDLTLSNGSPA